MAQTPEQIQAQLAEEDAKRKGLEKRIADVKSGLSEKAEQDRLALIQKLEELKGLSGEAAGLAISRAIEALAQIVDTPVLTREASLALTRALEKWLADTSTDLSTFMHSINDMISGFIDKYTDELNHQIAARKKEAEVLDQLSRYLARYI